MYLYAIGTLIVLLLVAQLSAYIYNQMYPPCDSIDEYFNSAKKIPQNAVEAMKTIDVHPEKYKSPPPPNRNATSYNTSDPVLSIIDNMFSSNNKNESEIEPPNIISDLSDISESKAVPRRFLPRQTPVSLSVSSQLIDGYSGLPDRE
jgi:hypothetical protein